MEANLAETEVLETTQMEVIITSLVLERLSRMGENQELAFHSSNRQSTDDAGKSGFGGEAMPESLLDQV